MNDILYDKLIGMIVKSSDEGLQNDYALFDLINHLIETVIKLTQRVSKLETRIIELESLNKESPNVKH